MMELIYWIIELSWRCLAFVLANILTRIEKNRNCGCDSFRIHSWDFVVSFDQKSYCWKWLEPENDMCILTNIHRKKVELTIQWIEQTIVVMFSIPCIWKLYGFGLKILNGFEEVGTRIFIMENKNKINSTRKS